MSVGLQSSFAPAAQKTSSNFIQNSSAITAIAAIVANDSIFPRLYTPSLACGGGLGWGKGWGQTPVDTQQEILTGNQNLAAKLNELEHKIDSHDQAIAGILNAIRERMKPAQTKQRPIGFITPSEKKKR